MMAKVQSSREKQRWSYTAGEKGRNWVRAYCKGCPGKPKCRTAKTHTGGLYLEWFETVVDPESGDPVLDPRSGRPKQRRPRVLMKDVSDTIEASRRADRLAAEFAEVDEEHSTNAPITISRLIGLYLKEATPRKGESKRGHDNRAARLWRAFFDSQEEGARRSTRVPGTLDRIDWDRFIVARRAGLVAGWKPVRDRQVEYDLKFMIAVLNWGTGCQVNGKPALVTNPWAAEIRRAQKWGFPQELNPVRPAMTDDLRDRLSAHCSNWQFRLALTLGRQTASRNASVRRLRWSDIDLEEGTVRWRGCFDKSGLERVTPLSDEAVEALRQVPVRGIGEAWVFPSDEDPSQPTSRNTFQVWLRRAKQGLLASIDDDAERDRMSERLKGLGYHGEKRAAVRDSDFRSYSPAVQEAMARTSFDTLRRVYDEVTVEDMREEIRRARERNAPAMSRSSDTRN